VNGSKHTSALAKSTRTVTNLNGKPTPSAFSGIVHAPSANVAGYSEQAAADVVPVLGFTIPSCFVRMPERGFRFVRHGNPEFLIPNDGSTIVVAKVQGRTSNGSVLIGALDSNELQAHFAKYESCPHQLNYKWRCRPCSYLVRISDPNPPDFVPHFEVCGMSHCWCGNPRTEFTYNVSGLRHLLLSVCHPVDPLLSGQHKAEGSLPSCEFTPEFIDLIPPFYHICHKFKDFEIDYEILEYEIPDSNS